jgi:hypothetical protein
MSFTVLKFVVPGTEFQKPWSHEFYSLKIRGSRERISKTMVPMSFTVLKFMVPGI